MQVVVEEEARERLAFFTPNGKIRWKSMPMGALNAYPTFVAIVMKLQMEWDTLATEHGLKNISSKIILDDVLLYVRTSEQLLDYFITVLDVLKHHPATPKIKRCKRFQYRFNFVGMDVSAGGTQPS